MNPREIRLERLRWPEVGQALEDGMTTVIVPCGAIEQHGPHLPLFMDAEHGTRLGEEVARRLGNALVAPTIRVGCSEHHMAFPGTLSLEASTFLAVCRDYCRSLGRHGFTKICMLPSHGGNFGPLADGLDALNDAAGPDCTVVAYVDLEEVVDVWKRVVETECGLGSRVGGHADIAESSIMLTLHPELVCESEAREGFFPRSGEDRQRLIRDGLKSVTATGILGDARGMAAPIGAKCVDALADVIARRFAP